jgi:uncharacterized protein (TIGR00266 family)
MKQKVNGRPSFAHVQLMLEPGESIITESGAMASMDCDITHNVQTHGGIFSSFIKKLFAQESFFLNRFTNEGDTPSRMTITQDTPGDIMTVKLGGNEHPNGLYIQPGAFIARTQDVKLSVCWAGFRSWFAGEGLMRIKAHGTGFMWLGGYGHVYEKGVSGAYLIDGSHIIAYEPSLNIRLQLSGGLFSSFFSGEGFVTRMEGEGKIYMQSRSLNGLVSFMNPRI